MLAVFINMIFVTVGSQKFQFNRLLKAVDECIYNKTFKEKVFAQTGASTYRPKYYDFEPFLNRDIFANKMEKSDIVITHGGTGAIIKALKAGKKIIAMPRLAKYGEHVDNHQKQVLTELTQLGYIQMCEDVQSLMQAYRHIKEVPLVQFVSNNGNFINDLDLYLSMWK